ncbi:MAG: FG-GAP-like repeat-containing protein [Blastocatellia bacterium]|nr:FG-GAP-like repeat-containing protein [Blastocatellia bacterium]
MVKRGRFVAFLCLLVVFAVSAGSRLTVNAGSGQTGPRLQAPRAVAAPLPRFESRLIHPFDPASDSSPEAGTGVATGDFNGDGIPEFAVLGDGSVTFYQGTSAGEFLPGSTSIATGINTIAAADIDRDGWTELLELNSQTGTLMVYGDGRSPGRMQSWSTASDWQLRGLLSVVSGATRLATGDVNGDGFQDVLALGPQQFTLLLGSTEGLTQAGTWSAPSGSQLRDAAFDTQGNRILMADEGGQQVLVWQFQASQIEVAANLPLGISVTALVVGDLNGDGQPDVVAASQEGFLAVALGKPDGSFETSKLFPSRAGTTRMELAQVNTDGWVDILLNDATGRIAAAFGTGDGGFAAPVLIGQAGQAKAWVSTRINADAFSDMATVNQTGLSFIVTQPQATLTVTTVQDNGDNNSPTPGSLRKAILDSIANGGPDSIVFNIPVGQATNGIFIIKPPIPLPAVSGGATTIDGSTQRTNTSTDTNPSGPEIFIDGSTQGVTVGLVLNSGSNVVREIGIGKTNGPGIQITGAGVINNSIEGCYIGTNSDATAAQGNQVGIDVRNGASSNAIGGATAAARNIISGNSNFGIVFDGAGTTNNSIRNNVIGLNRAEAAAVGNNGGISIQAGSSNNIIGGLGTSDGNTIAGNVTPARPDILITGTGTISNSVQGNRIGTNAARATLSAGGDTIRISGNASLNQIGSTSSGGGNLIGFSGGNGVTVGDSPADANTLRNTIQRNTIFGASGLPIDLGGDGATNNDSGDTDSGPNGLQNRPVIGSVTLSGANLVISGSLDTPNPNTATIEIYADFAAIANPPTPANQVFLITATPQANGTFTATVAAPSGSFTVSSNATDALGNTSEFSAGVSVTTLPDLLPQNLGVNPNIIAAGGTVTVSFTVRNQGNAPTTVTSTASIVLSTDNVIDSTDIQIGTISTQPLAASGTVNLTASSLTIPAGTPTGARFIGVIVDSGNAVSESSETNNTASVSLTIAAPKPDLAVGALSLSSAATPPGGAVTVNLTVSNRGTGNAAASVTQVRLSTDGTIGPEDALLANINTGSIVGGASLPLTMTVTIPTSVAPGSYFIGVVLDSANSNDEADETNNSGSVPFLVSGLPDLIVETLNVNPLNVAPGGNLTISFNIRNQGSTAAPSTTHDVLLSLDNTIRNGEDLLLVSRPTGTLAPAEVSTVTVTITLPANVGPGAKFIGVIADSGNLVGEANENNNIRSTPIAVVDAVPPTASLLRPKGGETLAAGRAFDRIEWTAGDDIGIASQELRLSTDGGLTFPSVITTGIAGDVRSFVWPIPTGLNTATARVQVVVKDAAGNQATSASPQNFLIAPPPVIVTGFKLGGSGKFVFVVANSNIQAGAKLRVTVGTTTETFDMTVKPTKILVKGDVRSTPGNKTTLDLLPKGTQSTLVVVNPNGVTSDPVAFTAP